MDERKKTNNDKGHSPNQPSNNENRTTCSPISSGELNISNENRLSCSELEPALNQICTERKENPNRYLEDHNNDSSNTSMAGSSEISDDDNSKDTEKIKTNYIRKTVSKFFSRALKGPTGAMKKIKKAWKRSKSPKDFEPDSREILANDEKDAFQMDKPKTFTSERHKPQTHLEDSMTRTTNIKKRKRKPDVYERFVMQSETSIKENALTVLSASPTPESQSQNDSEIRTHSPKVRSSEEVLEHFRCFMRSKTIASNRVESGDINREDANLSSESRSQRFHRLMKLETELAHLDLKSFDQTTASSSATRSNITIQEESKIPGNSRKFFNLVPLTETYSSATLSERPKNIHRQRIVHDEKNELFRGWIIQQIKDKEITLKFRIMEGQYSEDVETKLRCIEEAEDIQDDIDELLDALDDTDKVPTPSKRVRRSSSSIQDGLSIAPSTKKKDYSNIPYGQLRSFMDLFIYLHKFSEYNKENIIESVNPKTFATAYLVYLIFKEKHDRKSKISENNALNAIDKFNLALIQARAKIKFECVHTESRLSDYEKYIDLQIAAKQNLTYLQALLPQVTSVIFPLMSYLGQARRKFVKIISFLNEEKPDVFLDKYKAFFEEFCSHYFKN